MKLVKLESNGYRSLRDCVHDFTDPRTGLPCDLVIVSGSPAAGKTTFLEAIVAATEDVRSQRAMSPSRNCIRPPGAAAKLKVDWLLTEHERARTGGRSHRLQSESIFGDAYVPLPDHDPALVDLLDECYSDPKCGRVEYFASNRRFEVAGLFSPGMPGGMSGRRSLSRDNEKYADLDQFMAELVSGLQGEENRARAVMAFEMACRTKQLEGLRVMDGRNRLAFAGKGGRVARTELSDGEQQAFIFAATFLMARLDNSIVLIDTPELNLSSQGARDMLDGIRHLGTNNQLIVATNCPEALKGDGVVLVNLEGV